MIEVANSLIPVALILATGWATRASGLLSDRDWQGCERVAYYIFFPAVVIDTLARADLSNVPVIATGLSLITGILIVSGALLLARGFLQRVLSLDGPAFTSVFQGAIRWNTFVALSLAAALYGAEGLALMAVAIAAMIPLLNLISILVLLRHAAPADAVRPSPWSIALTLLRNPFIWSSIVGIIINAAAMSLPKALFAYSSGLGSAALAAGLLVVGAGLDLKRLARPGAAHALAIMLKLIVMPLIVGGTAYLLGLTGAALAVTTIAAAVPTASASYILARQFGGNADLIAEILTMQTLLALFTIPLMVGFVSALSGA